MDLQLAISTIENGFKQFKAFEHSKQALEVLRGLANYEREVKARIEDALKEERKAVAAKEAAQVEARCAAIDGMNAEQEAKKKAATIIADANQYAAKSKADAEAMLDEANAEKELVAAEKAALKNEIEKLKNVKAQLDAHIESVKKSLGV